MLRKFQQSLLAAVAVGLILGRLQNVTPAGHKRKTIAGNLDSGLKVYDLFRRYIEHENHLVNQRLTWLLTIHGFLYATCGLVLQKKVEIDRNISSDLFSRVVACQTIEQIKAKGCIGRLDFVQVTDGNNIIFKS